MALEPLHPAHAAQIQAGIYGRNRGHAFEFDLAQHINALSFPRSSCVLDHPVFKGDPASMLTGVAASYLDWTHCEHAQAIALGAIATAETGKKWLEVNGVSVGACKSDILLTLSRDGYETTSIGISIKQCNNPKPTNAQLYFTTAHSFCELLRRNNIRVSSHAETALRQFCGDIGYRPLDNRDAYVNRKVDCRRFFWEETDQSGRKELECIFTQYQDIITRLLLQKAYLDDPFTPDLILHKTKKLQTDPQEFALYSVNQLVDLSRKYKGFNKKLYSVRKGQYKDPPGVAHEAPRFGIVQMQRGGQRQHPTQLQFNLEAGYFYKI
ncbi:MAG: hypothetical protein WA982_14930 [Rubrobacteraceae bacterium]